MGGVIKYFRMSYEEVVFKRSFLNIMLLNRSIPSFKLDNDRGNPTLHGGSGKTKVVPRKDSQHHSDFFMQFM